jgi:hypothetical protein
MEEIKKALNKIIEKKYGQLTVKVHNGQICQLNITLKKKYDTNQKQHPTKS